MSAELAPAAQYLRMSSEHQSYSLRNQAHAIEQYASAHGFRIVRTYLDAGKSGLTFSRRRGLQALLSDALQADRDFRAVLVLDVSRWGRFQDLDQSAHYEFLCRQAGVAVIYCAEPFANDGSPSAALIKELKRLMAAEYSRELSRKVAAAKRLQAELGYRMGGPLIYGVQRLILDPRGRPRGLLRRGEQKAQADDRVVLRQGPEHELKTLRWVFRRFVVDEHTPTEIAAELNRDGVTFIGRRRWSRDAIVRLLRHELMIGVYVYDRTSSPLLGPLVMNRPEEWVSVKVFQPIVSPHLFRRAQTRLGNVRSRQSRHQMLLSLRALLDKHGRLSAALIARSRETPCVNSYHRHFGSLMGAYAAVGYTPSAKATAVSRGPAKHPS
jgi:DNA invertase Pin-like site-specific DNA recombinase